MIWRSNETPPGGNDSRASSRWLAALAAMTLGLVVAILWSRQFPPLVDLPNHLAQHVLEYRWWSGEGLPSFYRLEYHLVPYMGSDLIVVPLLAVMPPLVAVKVLLTLSVVVYWLGPYLYFRRVAATPAGAAGAGVLMLPLLLFTVFFMGFIKYYLGIGLLFLVLQNHCRLESQTKVSAVGLVVQATLISLLFICHLAAWTLYGILAATRIAWAAWEAWSMADPSRRRSCFVKLFWLSAILVPSSILLLLYKTDPTNHFAVDPRSAYSWGGVLRKLRMPFFVFRSYHLGTDAVVVLLWLAVVSLWFRLGKPRSRETFIAALSIASLGVFYLILPMRLGETYEADARVLPVAMICALGLLTQLSVRPNWRLGAAIMVACLLIRYGGIALEWNRLGRRLDDCAAVLRLLPEGSRVLPVWLGIPASRFVPECHFHAYSVVYAQAFDPGLFDLPGQTPLRFTTDCRNPSCFDYLWVLQGDGQLFSPPPMFERVETRGSLSLWRRNHVEPQVEGSRLEPYMSY